MAIASLICGIISAVLSALLWGIKGGALIIPFAFIFAVLALIFGVKTRKINKKGLTGMILGIICICVCVAEASYVCVVLKRIGEGLKEI